MPIYEFFCKDCNTIFNFFSSRVNTTKQPMCPKCNRVRLKRQVSVFAAIGRAKEGGDDLGLDLDESRMEQAMEGLAREAEHLNEEDPRQMAGLMRKFSQQTGIHLGNGMEEAMARMEAGEDPEKIEQEMGDILENEDPFLMPGKPGEKLPRRPGPVHDETLYEL